MTVEVFADIWCPFAYVGLRAAFAQRARSGHTGVPIVVRAWPLELVNGTPMSAAGAHDHADELREQVAPDLFADLDITRFPTSTLDALALCAHAYRSAPSLGERAAMAVREALFEHGRDISQLSVLQEIAGELGTGMPDAADSATVRADWAEGIARGVVGSPHFFSGELSMFCPSLNISRVPGAGLTISADAERLAAFLAQCFSQP
jgi:predicted DsbA family dithiol-disulfide isomerase